MLKQMVRGSLGRLGFSISRGNPRAELHATRVELDRAHRELAATRQTLNEIRDEYRVLLEQTRTATQRAKEATLVDPPAAVRLKDSPAILAAVRHYLTTAALPDTVNQILLDPEFSLDDRSRYMKLFHHAYPEHYDRVVAALAIVINGQRFAYTPRQSNQALARERAHTLRTQGIVHLGQPFTPQQVQEMQHHFLMHGIYNGHIPMSAPNRSLRRYVNYTAEKFPLGCYAGQDIALAPHLLEFTLSPLILDTAAAYFGCAPRLSWLQSWWNFSGPGDYPHRQNYFHRDTSDFGMFWVYIYLTDVDAGSGPHRIIRQSGDFALVRERFEKTKANPALAHLTGDLEYHHLSGTGHNVSDEVKEAAFEGLAETVMGPAGTAFITRGVDLHKVMTPLLKKRQIFAGRFCVNEFPYNGADRDGDRIPGEVVAERIGSDEQLRYITGARFDWSRWNKQ